MEYTEVEGDLIKLALQGNFDVIAHGCNCFCVMGAGIAPQMAKAFGMDQLSLESVQYRGEINKLGQIETKAMVHGDSVFTVVNAYTQFGIARDLSNETPPLDYEALTLCLRKMNYMFKGKHIGLPQIGCGLAGGMWEDRPGDWNYGSNRTVKSIIQRELQDCKVTVVIYKP